MGLTNMVAYMWNTDRKAAFIKIIDAFEVTAALPGICYTDSRSQNLSNPALNCPADPEPVLPDFADDHDACKPRTRTI